MTYYRVIMNNNVIIYRKVCSSHFITCRKRIYRNIANYFQAGTYGRIRHGQHIHCRFTDNVQCGTERSSLDNVQSRT